MKRWTEKFAKITKFSKDKSFLLASRYHRLFFGALIFRGRKLAAFNMFMNIKYQLKLRESYDPYFIFYVAMLKITPEVFLVTLPLGSVKYGVPLPITEIKKISFAVKWIVKLLKNKNSKVTVKTITDLLIASVYSKGDAIKKKEEIYKIARLNRHLVKKLMS
jgi:small subunit ribosomal protein S7